MDQKWWQIQTKRDKNVFLPKKNFPPTVPYKLYSITPNSQMYECHTVLLAFWLGHKYNKIYWTIIFYFGQYQASGLPERPLLEATKPAFEPISIFQLQLDIGYQNDIALEQFQYTPLVDFLFFFQSALGMLSTKGPKHRRRTKTKLEHSQQKVSFQFDWCNIVLHVPQMSPKQLSNNNSVNIS